MLRADTGQSSIVRETLPGIALDSLQNRRVTTKDYIGSHKGFTQFHKSLSINNNRE